MARLWEEDKSTWKRLELPSTQDETGNDKAWVVMDTGPLISADTLDVLPGVSAMRANISMLARRIKEWNLEDSNGIVKITSENIARLKIEDTRFLVEQISKGDDKALTDEEKKTSQSISVTSPPEVNTTSPVSQPQ